MSKINIKKEPFNKNLRNVLLGTLWSYFKLNKITMLSLQHKQVCYKVKRTNRDHVIRVAFVILTLLL